MHNHKATNRCTTALRLFLVAALLIVGARQGRAGELNRENRIERSLLSHIAPKVHRTIDVDYGGTCDDPPAGVSLIELQNLNSDYIDKGLLPLWLLDLAQGAIDGQIWFDNPITLEWMLTPRNRRVFISHARQDAEQALEAKRIIQDDGFAVFLYLNDHGEPGQSVAQAGAFLAQAGHHLAIDSAHARQSGAVFLERELVEYYLSQGIAAEPWFMGPPPQAPKHLEELRRSWAYTIIADILDWELGLTPRALAQKGRYRQWRLRSALSRLDSLDEMQVALQFRQAYPSEAHLLQEHDLAHLITEIAEDRRTRIINHIRSNTGELTIPWRPGKPMPIIRRFNLDAARIPPERLLEPPLTHYRSASAKETHTRDWCLATTLRFQRDPDSVIEEMRNWGPDQLEAFWASITAEGLESQIEMAETLARIKSTSTPPSSLDSSRVGRTRGTNKRKPSGSAGG